MRSLFFSSLLIGTLSLGLASAAAAEPPSLTGQPMASAATILTGDDVPFAVRAEVFLGSLAALHTEDSEQAATLLRSYGIEPTSRAAQDLVEAATGLEQDHPKASEGTRRMAKANGEIDLEQPGGWVDQRYAKAGRTFGVWLKQREADGWAVDPLLDRILNNGQLSVTVFSDDDEATVLARLDRQSSLFHQHLTAELGRLPRRFEQR